MAEKTKSLKKKKKTKKLCKDFSNYEETVMKSEEKRAHKNIDRDQEARYLKNRINNKKNR